MSDEDIRSKVDHAGAKYWAKEVDALRAKLAKERAAVDALIIVVHGLSRTATTYSDALAAIEAVRKSREA